MCKKMCNKITAVVVIALALATAIFITAWPQKSLFLMGNVIRFFDVMLPILAVGALLKYLLCGTCHCHHEEQVCKK